MMGSPDLLCFGGYLVTSSKTDQRLLPSHTGADTTRLQSDAVNSATLEAAVKSARITTRKNLIKI